MNDAENGMFDGSENKRQKTFPKTVRVVARSVMKNIGKTPRNTRTKRKKKPFFSLSETEDFHKSGRYLGHFRKRRSGKSLQCFF